MINELLTRQISEFQRDIKELFPFMSKFTVESLVKRYKIDQQELLEAKDRELREMVEKLPNATVKIEMYPELELEYAVNRKDIINQLNNYE